MKTSFYVFVSLCALPLLCMFVWWMVERARTRHARRVFELRRSMLERSLESVDVAIEEAKARVAAKGMAESVAPVSVTGAAPVSVVGATPVAHVKIRPCANAECGHLLFTHRSVSNGRTTEFYECSVLGCLCRKGRRPPPLPPQTPSQTPPTAAE